MDGKRLFREATESQNIEFYQYIDWLEKKVLKAKDEHRFKKYQRRIQKHDQDNRTVKQGAILIRDHEAPLKGVVFEKHYTVFDEYF